MPISGDSINLSATNTNSKKLSMDKMTSCFLVDPSKDVNNTAWTNCNGDLASEYQIETVQDGVKSTGCEESQQSALHLQTQKRRHCSMDESMTLARYAIESSYNIPAPSCLQRLQRINEYLARAPAVKCANEGQGMSWWVGFVEEFWEQDPGIRAANSPSDVGVSLWMNADKGKRSFFVPRQLLARFFWSWIEESCCQEGMPRCRLLFDGIHETQTKIQRKGFPTAVFMIEIVGGGILQINRPAVLSEQSGDIRFWFSKATGKLIRWEWSVEKFSEWHLTGSNLTGKPTLLASGFGSKTWGVLEVKNELSFR